MKWSLIFIVCFFVGGHDLSAKDKHHHHKSKTHHKKHKGHHHQKAHVHGEAKLQIVIVDRSAVVKFSSPADNIYGFEHKPKSQKDKATVAMMNKRLAEVATQLVEFTPKPKCTQKQSLSLPFDKHDHSGEHADIEVELKYTCTKTLEDAKVTAHIKKLFPKVKVVKAVLVTSKKEYAAHLKEASQVLKP